MPIGLLPAIGLGLAALGQIGGGIAEKEAGEYNAAIKRRNAAVHRDMAAAEAVQQQRKARKVIGSMRAAYGASGVTVEGSPLEVLQESARAAERDRAMIIYRGELRAIGAEAQASLDEEMGQSAERAGYLSGAGELLYGFGRD